MADPRPRLPEAEWTPEVRRKLREGAKITKRLHEHAADSTRRAQIVIDLEELGVSVSAISRAWGVVPSALHKSKTRLAAAKAAEG